MNSQSSDYVSVDSISPLKKTTSEQVYSRSKKGKDSFPLLQ